MQETHDEKLIYVLREILQETSEIDILEVETSPDPYYLGGCV